MIVRSLRWRLLLAAAAAIMVALAVAWLVMTFLFERHLERRLEAELVRDGHRIAAALELAPDGAPVILTSPADPRLQTPAGGYYWQASNAAGAARSRSLWDAELPAPAPGAVDGANWRLRRANGPFARPVVLLERVVEPDPGRPGVLIQLAQDTAPLATARGEFGRETAFFLILLWLVLSAAAWVQVHLGLRPLARVRGDLARLRDNPSARLERADLREIQPLTDAINALAASRERDLEAVRRRAADLAHGLKTPLAAMTAQSRRAREAGASEAADGLDRAIAAIGRTVEAELVRVRAAVIRSEPGGHADVRETAERLVNVLEHTDRGSGLVFNLDLPAGLQLGIHSGDLSEILGAVLENAARFARRQVWITAEAGPEWTRLIVEDDGPGIPEADLRTALARGGRLDEARAGSGLGLSIARELVEATGGAMDLSASPNGGLKVDFTWVKQTGQAPTGR